MGSLDMLGHQNKQTNRDTFLLDIYVYLDIKTHKKITTQMNLFKKIYFIQSLYINFNSCLKNLFDNCLVMTTCNSLMN